MPRTQTVKCSWNGGAEREYRVTYLDDSKPRQEAIEFFGRYKRLMPYSAIPYEFHKISFDEAQTHLDAHPVQERWEFLSIGQKDLIFDDDLARLQHLPEITSVQFISSRITDVGIAHLSHLIALRRLVLYSRRVTNRCLKYVELNKSLESLDLQMSPMVSRSMFMATVKKLPAVSERYPPWRQHWLAIFRWFYTEWRIQREQRKTQT